MNISMHAMSHDVFKKALTQLLHVMEKGVANAKARNFDTSVLVSARLAPDMLPFAKQVQLTSDFAKNSMARLAGIDPPKFEDNETTMDELVARVKKTIDYIDSVSAAALEGSETRDIKIPLRDRTRGDQGTRRSCRTGRSRTSSSTTSPPTTCCATTASISASGIFSVDKARRIRLGGKKRAGFAAGPLRLC